MATPRAVRASRLARREVCSRLSRRRGTACLHPVDAAIPARRNTAIQSINSLSKPLPQPSVAASRTPAAFDEQLLVQSGCGRGRCAPSGLLGELDEVKTQRRKKRRELFSAFEVITTTGRSRAITRRPSVRRTASVQLVTSRRKLQVALSTSSMRTPPMREAKLARGPVLDVPADVLTSPSPNRESYRRCTVS